MSCYVYGEEWEWCQIIDLNDNLHLPILYLRTRYALHYSRISFPFILRFTTIYKHPHSFPFFVKITSYFVRLISPFKTLSVHTFKYHQHVWFITKGINGNQLTINFLFQNNPSRRQIIKQALRFNFIECFLKVDWFWTWKLLITIQIYSKI